MKPGGILMTNEDYQKIFHEIKNYITFINSSLQLVEKMHPEIKEYPYWTDSMQELSSLKRMLVELNSARLNSELTLTQISPNNFLSELKNSCSAMFDSKDFKLEVTADASLPMCSIDSDRLKRALLNIIKNAYEAMNGIGIVQLAAYGQNTFLRLDIIDSGGGIAPEYLTDLFTPFATTKQGGTGLGLLIARQDIEAHGGRLTVESRPQDGCTFSVFLPISN